MTTPEEPLSKTDFVSIDGDMLKKQNEKLDVLNESLQQLSLAVADRPTKRAIEAQRKRGRNRGLAVSLIFTLLLGWLYVQNHRITQQCFDRNSNSLKFRTLLEKIVPTSESPNLTPAQRDIQRALQDYKNSLNQVKC